jgi:hypothetical protein
MSDYQELRDIAETIELGLKRGYTPAELLDENSPIRDRLRSAIAVVPEARADSAVPSSHVSETDVDIYEEGVRYGRALAVKRPSASRQSSESILREALAIGLDLAKAAEAEAFTLYGKYPPDGLGRRWLAAKRDVETMEAARSALAGIPK